MSNFNCKCCGAEQSREEVGTYEVLNPVCTNCGEPTEGDYYVEDNVNTITVVNKRDGIDGEYIGRPSPLGNPFTHLETSKYATEFCNTRDESVEKYENWLFDKVASGDEAVCNELQRLYDLSKEGNLNLICWCKPLSCHGDTVKKLIDTITHISKRLGEDLTISGFKMKYLTAE